MSEPARHAQFLVARLRDMGLKVEFAADRRAGFGRLSLSTTSFQTLLEPFVAQSARFYTLGHARLKFYQPRVFFELPAVDITRCRSADDVESALRRAWSVRIRELREAKDWLDRLGAETKLSTGGTRLLLPISSERMPAAIVRSCREILLPSGGPLAEVSPRDTSDRRYRPLRNLDHPCELELGLSNALTRAATRSQRQPRAAAPARPEADAKRVPRILALDDETASLAAMRAVLDGKGFEVDGFRDPQRALEAFREKSYDLVVTDARLSRVDGLEFTARLQELAGIERLPVILLDERLNGETARAACAAGAAAYFAKPFTWAEVGETLIDLLDRPARRSFERYPVRLAVRVSTRHGISSELTAAVGRGGMCLQTRREVVPGEVERYRIALPHPLRPVEVDTLTVNRIFQPGRATLLAGVRFLRFLKGGEADWIRLISELARRAARKPALGEP